MLHLYEIEIALATYFGYTTHIIVPNVRTGIQCHECDLLVVYPSGLAVEVEIKRSKEDTKADLLKYHKHNSTRISALYFALPEELYESCLEFIPEKAGILVVSAKGGVICKRKPIKNKFAIKLSEIEIKKITRLGYLRIWSLKRKLCNKETKLLDQILQENVCDPTTIPAVSGNYWR